MYKPNGYYLSKISINIYVLKDKITKTMPEDGKQLWDSCYF